MKSPRRKYSNNKIVKTNRKSGRKSRRKSRKSRKFGWNPFATKPVAPPVQDIKTPSISEFLLNFLPNFISKKKYKKYSEYITKLSEPIDKAINDIVDPKESQKNLTFKQKFFAWLGSLSVSQAYVIKRLYKTIYDIKTKPDTLSNLAIKFSDKI